MFYFSVLTFVISRIYLNVTKYEQAIYNQYEIYKETIYHKQNERWWVKAKKSVQHLFNKHL